MLVHLHSENTLNCPITDTFGCYIWKAETDEASNTGTPKLELKMQRDCTINQIPHPLPAIRTTQVHPIIYTCCSNIHYLLHMMQLFSSHHYVALHLFQEMILQVCNLTSLYIVCTFIIFVHAHYFSRR